MKAECKQQADKAERLANQSQKQSHGRTDIVNKLEEKRDSQLFQDESLKSQLIIVHTEHIAIEKDLTENISLLSQQERNLSVSCTYISACLARYYYYVGKNAIKGF